MVKIKKKQKGGKVLGVGRDGCVVDPHVSCDAKSENFIKNNNKKYISKLIDITKVNKAQYDAFIREFKVGQIFRNYDKDTLFFLPGLTYCIKDKKMYKDNKDISDDLRTCTARYAKWNDTKSYDKFINILMPKGLDYIKTINKLSEVDAVKSLVYLLEAAKRCVYDLNICLLDIKSPNLLFVEDKTIHKNNIINILHPVFIDFSEDFVIRKKDQLTNIIIRMGITPSFYGVLAPEILLTIENYHYEQFIKTNKSKNIKPYHDFIKDVYEVTNYNATTDREKIRSVYHYMRSNIKNNNVQVLYNKIMLYQITQSFNVSYNKPRSHKLNNIINLLTNPDVFTRPFLDKAIKMIRIAYPETKDYIIYLKNTSNEQELQAKPKTVPVNKLKGKKINIKPAENKQLSKIIEENIDNIDVKQNKTKIGKLKKFFTKAKNKLIKPKREAPKIITTRIVNLN